MIDYECDYSISKILYLKEQLDGLGCKSLISESSNSIIGSKLVRDPEDSNGVLSDSLTRGGVSLLRQI